MFGSILKTKKNFLLSIFSIGLLLSVAGPVWAVEPTPSQREIYNPTGGQDYTYDQLISRGISIAQMPEADRDDNDKLILNAAKAAAKANQGNLAAEAMFLNNQDICGFNLLCQLGKAFAGIGDGLGKIVVGVVLWLLDFVLLPTASFVLSIAGQLFDTAVRYSIYNVSTLLGDGGPIITIWKIVRDVANISFIFGLLWIAISTILDIAGRDMKKMVGGIIVAALFINFSMFVTKVVIDTGNIFASQIYKQILKNGIEDDKGIPNISSAIMNGLYLQNLYGFDGSQGGQNQGLSSGAKSAISVGAIIVSALRLALVCYATWAFMIAAMLFVGRYVAFVFLMAFSPVGFLGGVFPKLKSYSEKWFDTLIEQAIVAPIFLLGIFLVVRLVNSSSFTSVGTDTISMLSFVIVIIAIQKIVEISKKLSGEFGEQVSSVVKTAIGTAAGVAIGGAAIAGRATLGRAAATRLTDKEYMNGLREKAEKGSWVARQQIKALETGSKSNFDLRGNSIVAGQMKKTGIDFGKETGKGGYDAVVKEREKIYESKGPRDTDKAAGDKAVENHKADLAQRRTEVDLLAKEISRQETISTSTFASVAEKDAAREKAEKLKAEMKEKQGKIEEMKNKKEDQIRKKAETDSMVKRMEEGMGTAGKKVKEIEDEKERVKAKIAEMWKDPGKTKAEKEQSEIYYKEQIQKLNEQARKITLSKDEIARRKQIAEIKKRGGKSDSERFIEELQEKAKTEVGGSATPTPPAPTSSTPTT